MIKPLIRHGSNLALIIEKSILEQLEAGPETLFKVTADGKALILTPIQNEKLNKQAMDAVEKINKKYETALKKLSE